MPYSKSNPPDRIKSLPKHAQDIWVAAFKSAWDTYDGDEEKCNMVAWSAVKESYEKNADGKWVVKASEEDSLGSIVYIVDVSNVQLKEKDDSLVSDIQIFKTGEFFNTDYGDFEITAKDLENIEQNFSEGKRPKAPTEMVVDYEHDSAHRVGPSPAAGWVRNVFRKGRNLLFATVEWTKKAAEMIKNGEYKFVSPEYHYNYVDKETKEKLGPTLLAVALTNRPFLEGMQPVVLSENGIVELDDIPKEGSMEKSDFMKLIKSNSLSEETKKLVKEKLGFVEADLKMLQDIAVEDTPLNYGYWKLYEALANVLYLWVQKTEQGNEKDASYLDNVVQNLKDMLKLDIDKINSKKQTMKGGEVFTMKKENLIKKFKEELSKDKTFKLADDVSDEEKEVFEEASKEVSEEEKATKETEEKKTAEEKVKAEEEAKKKAEEEKETVEAKDKVITMSEKDHKELAEMAAKGAEAAKKLARMEVEKEVDSFVLSEKNTTGKIKPASRDKVIDLILSLNETQATQFREILKDLPEIKDVKLFAESGSGENLDVNDPDHVQLTERAKVYAKEHNMEFAEALREVSKKK